MSIAASHKCLLLIPAAAALSIGLAAPALADDFNPQPDPPGKPIAISSFERFDARFIPPPCRGSVCGLPAVQVHESLIARFGDTTVGGGPGVG